MYEARTKKAPARKKWQRAKFVLLSLAFRQYKLKQVRDARDSQLLKFGDGLKYRSRSFVRERIKCLDQVHLRVPRLPLSVEAHWEQRKLAFANNCCFWYKGATGTKFLNLINLLIAELGVHYEGRLAVKEKLCPEDEKYMKEHQNRFNNKHSFEDFAIALKVWVRPHRRYEAP